MKTFLQLAAVILWTGCATRDPYAALPRTGNLLTDGPTYIRQGPPGDKILWEYRTSLAWLRKGNDSEAKQLLDDALLSIGGIAANDKNAKRSRSYFHEEARKTFLGEPYERVMAYYYRAILYWKDGELDNARAAFRSGQVQDADTESKEYSSDYVLLDYLDGLATAKLGGDGQDAFKRAKSSCKLAIPPPYDPNANVLFFIEYGRGPTKYATGNYREQLRFLPGQSAAKEVVIRVADQAVRVGPYDDLTFQATTRGGRVMDHILANKAVFKSSVDMVGDAALISGLVLAHDRNTQEAALGLAAFGLLSKIVSAKTTPSADVRAWDNLPQYLSFAALRVPVGRHNATIEFVDHNHRLIPSLTKTVALNVPTLTSDGVVFVSDQSDTPQTL